MNKVILMGRLVRDPEVRYTQGNQPMAIAKFTLAVDRRAKKEQEQSADFISCTAFGKVADFIEKYIKKGTKVVLEGRWQTGSYKNKDGATVYTNDCVVDSLEFAESKRADEPQAQPQADADGFINLPDGIDEELPFATLGEEKFHTVTALF